MTRKKLSLPCHSERSRGISLCTVSTPFAKLSPKKPNPKRNHHILPKLYLRGFVTTPGKPFIWIYKRGESYVPGPGRLTNNPYCESISRLIIRDFYAYPNEGGRRDFESYENFLEKLEKPANSIFAKLRSRRTISSDEKQIFCVYLVQMLKRVPAHRRTLNEVATRIVANYELPENVLTRFKLPNTEETRQKVKQIATEISQKKGFDARIHLETISVAQSSQLIDVLAEMTWRFFVAPPTQAFLTGDNPFFFTKGIGLKHADSEVSFPISTDICLVASNRSYSECYILASSRVVKELNRRTASSSCESLYFAKDERWVVDVFNKRNHTLNQIP
jgi:hypothetical protein